MEDEDKLQRPDEDDIAEVTFTFNTYTLYSLCYSTLRDDIFTAAL